MATMNLDKFNSLPAKAQAQLRAAGLNYENKSGQLLKKLAEVDNAKVYAAGVKKFHLPPEYAKVYSKTIYEAKWEHTKSKFTKNKETLDAFLLLKSKMLVN